MHATKQSASHVCTTQPLPHVAVAVRDHEGPLENKFPVENRLLPQGGLQVDAPSAARPPAVAAAAAARRLDCFVVLVAACTCLPVCMQAQRSSSPTWQHSSACPAGSPSLPSTHRVLPPFCAGTAELKSHLAARRSKPYWARLADFHLLLYLARQPNFEEAEVGGCSAGRI